MPSIRKRIGYLPSINAQEMITKLAIKEKISQSKVVGILVEEALVAREKEELTIRNDLIRNKHYGKRVNIDNSYYNYNDIDELISDKGITYNTKKNGHISEDDLSVSSEKYNQVLFEEFKQFIMFKKMIIDK